jgi:hypothetical protein
LAQAFAALGFRLVCVEVARVGFIGAALLAVLFYALGFGFLVGEGGGFFRGFGFCGLFGLLALYFRVFGCVPRVENLLFFEEWWISAVS